MGPGSRAERYDVDMAGEAEWRLVRTAADARHQCAAARRKFNQLAVVTGRRQQLRQMVGALIFIAGRVDGIHAQQSAGQFYCSVVRIRQVQRQGGRLCGHGVSDELG